MKGSRFTLCRFTLLSVSLFTNQLLFAQASDTLSEEDFFVAPPKVASATLLRQPINETPVAVTVIDRKMIEASGAIHIIDLLRLVPGFQVGLSGLDHVGVATYHGHADAFPRRMQVLVDGRSVFGAIFSNIDWEDIGVQLEDIDRIEVIRGPNTTVYGANAFTAVIHIITKPAFADRTYFDQTLRGSLHTSQHLMRYVNQNKAWDYRLTLHDEASDGFENRNDETKVSGGDFRATHQINRNESLDLQTGYSSGPMGRAGETFDTRPLGKKQVSRQYQSLKWTRSFSDDTETSFQFSHAYRLEQDFAASGTLADLFGITPADVEALFPGHSNDILYTGGYDYAAQRLDAQWRYISNQHQRLRWVAGIDSRLDRLRSETFINNRSYVSATSTRFSFNGSYSVSPSVLFQTGLMREFSNTYIDTTSARAALNVHLNLENSVRVALTRGYRLPSLLEENFDLNLHFPDGTRILTIQYSGGGLLPERIFSRELGYNFNSNHFPSSLDLRLFHEQIDYEIEEVRDDNNNALNPQLGYNFDVPTFLRLNTGSTFIHGAEAQLDIKPHPDVLLHASYMIAASDMRGNPEATRFSKSVRGYPETPAIPRYSSSLLLSLGPRQGYSLSLGVYRQSTLAWWGDGDIANEYLRQDARLARAWRGSHLAAKLEFIVQNIGAPYVEFKQDNIFETQTYLRLSVEAE